jgi:mannose/fructose-specific phosphotransferase system component IIA
MMSSASDILGKGVSVDAVEVMPDSDIEEMNNMIIDKISGILEETKGVLLLTDMVGSTPANIAFNSAMKYINKGKSIRVLTGFNLPMLITALTYQRDETLDNLAKKVLETGKMTMIDLTIKYHNNDEMD